MKEYKTFIGVNISVSLATKIEEFMKRYKCNKTTAFTQLLELAFTIETKIGEVESMTPKDLEEIRHQLYEGKLVDWIQNMDPKKLEIMTDIFLVEKEARQKQKKIMQFT